MHREQGSADQLVWEFEAERGIFREKMEGNGNMVKKDGNNMEGHGRGTLVKLQHTRGG